MSKRCNRCNQEMTGWGTTCSACRKTKGAESTEPREKCVVCDQVAYAMERVVVEGQIFHPACFRCECCSKKLSFDNYLKSPDGKFYCEVHYAQIVQRHGLHVTHGITEEERKQMEEEAKEAAAVRLAEILAEIEVNSPVKMGQAETSMQDSSAVSSEQEHCIAGGPASNGDIATDQHQPAAQRLAEIMAEVEADTAEEQLVQDEGALRSPSASSVGSPSKEEAAEQEWKRIEAGAKKAAARRLAEMLKDEGAKQTQQQSLQEGATAEALTTTHSEQEHCPPEPKVTEEVSMTEQSFVVAREAADEEDKPEEASLVGKEQQKQKLEEADIVAAGTAEQEASSAATAELGTGVVDQVFDEEVTGEQLSQEQQQALEIDASKTADTELAGHQHEVIDEQLAQEQQKTLQDDASKTEDTELADHQAMRSPGTPALSMEEPAAEPQPADECSTSEDIVLPTSPCCFNIGDESADDQAEEKIPARAPLFRDLPAEVRDILAQGRPVDARDFRGFTAIMRAAERGSAEVVQALGELKADVNVKSDFGKRTALHYASAGGHFDAILMLLEQGAQVEALDLGANRPLELAQGKGHHACVEKLNEWMHKPVVVTIALSESSEPMCTLRCTSVGGSDLASWSVDSASEVIADIRAEIAKRLHVSKDLLRLISQSGALISEADNQRTLQEVFNVSSGNHL